MITDKWIGFAYRKTAVQLLTHYLQRCHIDDSLLPSEDSELGKESFPCEYIKLDQYGRPKIVRENEGKVTPLRVREISDPGVRKIREWWLEDTHPNYKWMVNAAANLRSIDSNIHGVKSGWLNCSLPKSNIVDTLPSSTLNLGLALADKYCPFIVFYMKDGKMRLHVPVLFDHTKKEKVNETV